MGRLVATILGIVLAAGTGLLVGYLQWGKQVTQAERVEQRLQSTASELTSLRDQKQQLEQRVDQLSKEEQRLAQENEILRKQQSTERLLGGQGGELPALPPK